MKEVASGWVQEDGDRRREIRNTTIEDTNGEKMSSEEWGINARSVTTDIKCSMVGTVFLVVMAFPLSLLNPSSAFCSPLLFRPFKLRDFISATFVLATNKNLSSGPVGQWWEDVEV